MNWSSFLCTFAQRKVFFVEVIQKIQEPIAFELEQYNTQFQASLQHENPMLQMALQHLLQRKGKLMRSTLLFLSARMYGQVNQNVMDAALALELLHTASLVHDDVVDESDRRRGIPSVNKLMGSKAAVLVGDFILSKALEHAAQTKNPEVVSVISQLGQALADGELKQLHNIESKKIDEASYYEVIRKKTASLFAASAQLGALLAGGTPENAERMRQFGQLVGICFQLRDDIFDYDESQDVGKPTGNDLREGKLTLPLIYALRQSNNEQMLAKAYKVRAHEATTEEVAELVEFTKQQGGLEYATWAMDEFRMMASGLIDESKHPEVVNSLHLYVDFVAKRNI